MLHISLYLFALLSLSTSPNWAKLNTMPPEILGFYRLFGATLLLLIFLCVSGRLQKIKFNSSFVWALVSGFFFFLHLWTYKFAAKTTLISNTMILFATNPVWATLGGQIFFKEPLKPRILLSYFLAFLGVFILVFQNLDITPDNHWGNTAALISAFFYAAYMMTSKKARQDLTNTSYALIQYSLTAGLFLISSIFTEAKLTGYETTSWVAVFGLIVFPTFLGHFTFTYLVKHMNLGFMTCGKLIEPILASIWAYFLFQEQLGSYAIYAFILTGFSVVILFWPTLTSKISK